MTNIVDFEHKEHIATNTQNYKDSLNAPLSISAMHRSRCASSPVLTP